MIFLINDQQIRDVLMEEFFGAYDKVIKIIVHNFGKQAEIDLNVGFFEGDLASTLLIDQFTTYVMRLAEISTYIPSLDSTEPDLTDEYIAEQFMDKELSHRNTSASFHMRRSDYGDDLYYGLSIHLDITDMYIVFKKKRLHRVVHWAWDHIGFTSLQTRLQMTFDEAVDKGRIVLIDDSKLDEFDYNKGWKIKMYLPYGFYHDEIGGRWQCFSGSWPNSKYDGETIRSDDSQLIRDNWNKDIGDITYYAVNDFIDGNGRTKFE